ncbi:2'-5' RNA ligase family protein [Cellulomonas triticagri]|uniref:2'-5' RNA ligase family protein n=1 Tax=Cellulomonas triticagri TaxID=2483352 RepID=A0A3M2JB63_9CELL|nr:2'-5' RNA ligase family protein [Cellulomonas triticagri]RMI09040.1 2'-5' RNA ligase family protein [Cellulomonas triticagri]
MNPSGPFGEELRVGVAVTVPEPYAADLRAVRSRVGDPAADLIQPHITLLGPTVVPSTALPEVEEHLREVADRHAPFTVHLRGTATFRPVSPVVFVQVVEGIASCELLEVDIRSGVLDSELRFHYHPHVTVAHEVPDAALDQAFTEMADFEARFDVPEIHVYEHGDDGVWRTMGAFPLAGSRA